MRKSGIGIVVSVEAGDWPPEAELRRIAEEAVAAAAGALDSQGSGRFSPHPGPPPQGGRENRPQGGREGAEVSILFTDDAAMKRLNAEYCGKDRPTNVLSFPQGAGPLLGDIVLAAETVGREAALAEKPLTHHIAHLLIHGFFHLIGYDHDADEDAEAMEELERAALSRLGIPDPYAAPQER